MEVAGLCAACGRPGALTTCSLCGSIVHASCLTQGLHAHGAPPGRRI